MPAQQTVDDWASFDPDAVPVDAVGHYMQRRRAAHASPPASRCPGRPGPARTGSPAPRSRPTPRTGELSFLAGVRPTPVRGQPCWPGPTAASSPRVLDGATLSRADRRRDPARRRGWCATATSVVRVPAGGAAAGGRAPPTLPGLGRRRCSGSRPTASGPRSSSTVRRARPLRRDGRPRRGGQRRAARPACRSRRRSSQVVDVAWRDSEELLVLAGAPGTTGSCPYAVGVDGWGLDDVPTAGLPERARPRSRPRPPAQPLGRRRRGRSGSWPAAPG